MALSLKDLEKRLKSLFNQGGQAVSKFAGDVTRPNPQRSVTQPGGQGLAQKAIRIARSPQTTNTINRVGQAIGNQPLLNTRVPFIRSQPPTIKIKQPFQAVAPNSFMSNLFRGDVKSGVNQLGKQFTNFNTGLNKIASPNRNESIEGLNTALGGITFAGVAKPTYKKAADYLRKTADKAAIDKVRDFVVRVENKGERVGLTDIGADIQHIANDVFGPGARKLTNKQLANAFDATLKQIGKQPNKFNLGLAVDDVRGGKKNVANDADINKYLTNAYKVFSGQKPSHIVANLSEDLAKKTNLPRTIVVKRAFYEKMAESHPDIDKKALFQYVKTLNIPDEIYQISKENRLNFFRQLENKALNLVSTGEDYGKLNQNVITSFNPTDPKELKYVNKLKNTSKKVFSKDSGGRAISSSDMLSQVPGAGARLPRSSESKNIIPQSVNIDQKISSKVDDPIQFENFLKGRIKDTMETKPIADMTNQSKAPMLRIKRGQGVNTIDNAAISSNFSDEGISGLNYQRQPLQSQAQPLIKLRQTQGGKIPAQKFQTTSQSLDDDILAQEGSKIKSFEKSDKRTIKQYASDFYTDWVNRFEPIEKLGKKAEKAGLNIKPEDNPQYAIKSLLGAGGKAELRHKQNLKPIIKELGDVPIKDFDLFLKAKRDVGFGSIGRNIKGSDPAKGQQIINALSQKYDVQKLDQVASKLYQYQDEGLKMLQKAGFIGDEGFDVIKARNPNYVPFQRVMDDLDSYLGVPTSRAHQPGQVVKKIEGSDRAILSPVESVIAQTYKMEAAIAKNNVARTIADFPEINPAYKDVIQKVGKSSENTISVWRNGAKEFYEVPEDINRAVKGLNEESMGTMMGVLSAPAKVLRQGATGRNIDFMLPNIVRDQLDAAINSKYGYKPVLGWVDGLAQIASYKWGKGDMYREYLNSGGRIFFENMAGRKAVAEQIKDSTTNKKLAKKIFDWGISGIEFLGKMSEEPTRVGLFAQARRKGAHPLEAAFESRESTVDFARMGAKMKVANSLIPFLNVQIQGFDKMLRSASRNPAAFGMKMAVYGTLPQTMASVYNNFYHADQYARVPDFEKETNLIIMQGQDEEGNPLYLKVPKGHTTQLVMNPADHFITWLAGNNPQSFGQLALATLSSALPIIGEGNTGKEVATRTFGGNLPQFLKPGVEAVSNFNFFRGGSIVPFYMGKKPPEEQYFKSTPAIYRKLGEITGISPLHLKNFAEATLAGGATQPANIIDLALSASENEPVNINKIPVLRRFRGSYGDFDVDRPEEASGGGMTFLPGKNNPESQGTKRGFGNLFGKAEATSNADEIEEISWTDDSGTTQTVELNTPDKRSVKGDLGSYKEETDAVSNARKIYHANNDQVTREQKLAAYEKLGFEEDDVRYHVRASDYDSDEKSAYIIDKYQDQPHDVLIDQLIKGRVKSVGGSYFANDGTLDNLYKAGMISSAERKYLKSLKLDKDYKPLAGTGSGGGKGKKPRKLSFPTPKAVKLTFSSSIGGRKVPVVKFSAPPIKTIKVKGVNKRSLEIAGASPKYTIKLNKLKGLTPGVKIV